MLYADHLEKIGTPVYHGAGIRWMIYNGALIPASIAPLFVTVDPETTRQLLAQSNCYFLRWSSDPSQEITTWWWMVCRNYSSKLISANTRYYIRRGYRTCTVNRISAGMLADSGYECYLKAFGRIKNADPETQDEFRSRILLIIGDEALFENWGVYVGGRLIGFAICTIEDNGAASIKEGRFDPEYLKFFPWYVLIDTILTEYVVKRGLALSNGERSIAHNTNMQNFLMKFGFERQYCRLNIYYQPFLNFAVSCLYPLRFIIPDLRKTHSLKAILFQEEVRRALG